MDFKKILSQLKKEFYALADLERGGMRSCPLTTEDFNSRVMSDGAVYKQKLPEEYSKETHGDATNYMFTLEELSARITIDRPVYKQTISDSNKNGSNSLWRSYCFEWQCRPKNFIKTTIPSINWLFNYNWKEWLIRDIISGFTVAVMNIPQGMAYALLGNVPPVVGIYMAFFPVLVYAFLGTSRHLSMGSFAVICLMAGNIVASHSSVPTSLQQHTAVQSNYTGYSPMEVATAITFLVGIYQVIMYFFRLGIICTLLSETLVSGLTAGAAIHVLTSQIKDILGLKLHQINGPFKLIYIYIEIFSKLQAVNIAATITSAITITILVTNNEILKPIVQKKTVIPVPIELLVVLAGTLVSNYCNLSEIYNLKTVGHIAVGLPAPMVPKFDLMPAIAVDSAIVAIIAYIVSLSMALIFANKLKYEVDANQELLAQGCGNLVGSFFSCLPFSASLSRSALQQAVGGVTQLASIVSCVLLLAVLLWIGPFFELLPRCILASLILVALKGILMQAKDIFQIWSISRSDGFIWLATYFTVIIVEIEYGLLVGVIVSILILIVRGARGEICLLGRVPNTEVYLEVNIEPKAEFIPGITIVRYSGSLNFINKSYFEKQLMNNLDITKENSLNKVNADLSKSKEIIIFDLKSLQYVDTTGGKTLKKIIKSISNNQIVYIVGLSETVIKVLQRLDVFKDCSVPLMPTVHDAVIIAQAKSLDPVYTVRL